MLPGPTGPWGQGTAASKAQSIKADQRAGNTHLSTKLPTPRCSPGHACPKDMSQHCWAMGWPLHAPRSSPPSAPEGPAQMQILPMLLLRKGPSSGPPTVSKELAWCSHGENCLETRLVSPAGAAQVTSSPEVESVLSEADWSPPCPTVWMVVLILPRSFFSPLRGKNVPQAVRHSEAEVLFSTGLSTEQRFYNP